MGFSAWPLSRYTRKRPSSRTSTRPTSRRTFRCLDTCGWPSPSCATRSPTGRSPSTNTSRISRRRGSATALNTSAVVAARATRHIIYLYRYTSSEDELDRVQRELELRAMADAVEDHPVGVSHLSPVARGRRRPREELVRGTPHEPERAEDRIERPVVASRELDHPRRLHAPRR